MAAAASAALLGVAHAFETFGHLAPCTLCLKQREVYWAALAIGGLGGALGLTRAGERATRVANVVLVLVFLFGAVIAFYHAGAEWKWWPGPASCSGGAGRASGADLDALLRGAKRTLPACDKAAWVFLGLSMAGWNVLMSLALSGASALATLRPSMRDQPT